MTSELNEKQWSVLSERGREVSGITYEEAARRVRELTRAKIYGLCVVTDAAAQRLIQMNQQHNGSHANTPAQKSRQTFRS